MTTIQIFALIGVFSIGAIVGGYVFFKFITFALDHSTVTAMLVVKCDDPKCEREHLLLAVQNPTPTLGTKSVRYGLTPDIAETLLTAGKLEGDRRKEIAAEIRAAGPVPMPVETPAEMEKRFAAAQGEVVEEQRKIWRKMAGEMRDVFLEAAHEEFTAERAKRITEKEKS